MGGLDLVGVLGPRQVFRALWLPGLGSGGGVLTHRSGDFPLAWCTQSPIKGSEEYQWQHGDPQINRVSQ